MPWKPSVKAWSTPVIENKREKGSNRLIGYCYDLNFAANRKC
jgi:hypothetical protein